MSMRFFRLLQFWKKKKIPVVPRPVVVLGGTLKFSNPVHIGNITFVSNPSDKGLVNGNGIYIGIVQFQVDTGATDGISQTTDPYIGSFNPSAQKCLLENQKPLRDNDSAVVIIPSKLITFPYSDTTFISKVVINDPGQDNTWVG